MVLIAAAVCNKTGKAIISRQFVELTKSRIEVFEFQILKRVRL